MNLTRLTLVQVAAYTLTLQVEPLPRGITLASPAGFVATYGIDPDAAFPQGLTAEPFLPNIGRRAMLTAVNEHSLVAAATDAGLASRALGEDIALSGVVLVSGDYLLELPGGSRTTVEATIASLPETVERPTELQLWGYTRRRAFDAVEPTTVPESAADLAEPWLHAIITGRLPDQVLVAQIASAINLEATRDRLLLDAVRLGFADLDDTSPDAEVMAALLGGNGRPQGRRLVTAALAAQFVAAHTTDQLAGAVLYAMSALLLWSEGSSRAASHAVDTALLHDRSCSLALTAATVVRALEYPEWFTR